MVRATLAILLLLPTVASAQTDAFRGIELNVLRPTPFADSGVVTDVAMPVPQWGYSAQLLIDYALNPLVWRNPDNTLTRAVSDQLYAHVLAHVSFFSWLQAGIDLPVSLLFRSEDLRALSPAPSSVAVGDLRLHVKGSFLNQFRHYVNVGIAADIGFPTGGGQAYISSQTVSGSPRVVVSRRFGDVEIAANLGARLRYGQEILNNFTASQLLYNIMFRWNLPWRAGPSSYEVMAEFWGLTAANRPFQREGENILEWLTSARVGLFDRVFITPSVGGGFIPGYGSPDFRAMLNLSWAPRDPDRDWDGIPDRIDRCPDSAETFNGIEDDDGCPETDRDGDGIIDILDKCPDQPETKNGFEDDDGCPDKKPRVKKKCAPVGPVKDAEENDEPDEKVVEECAEEPVPPPPPPVARSGRFDRDRDGIPDDQDKCPEQPENINGKDDDDGCPDEGKGVTVFVSKQKIGILEKINFETASAVIKQESYTILDQVAAQLRAHTEVRKMRIEGHTDSVGGDGYNLKLSQARADSVRNYLIEKGKVEPSRLSAVGYGETRPIQSNKTPRGRAQNRRVEFVILEQEDAP